MPWSLFEWAECGDGACGALAFIWVTLTESRWETDLRRAAMIRRGVSSWCPLFCHPPFQAPQSFLQHPQFSSSTIRKPLPKTTSIRSAFLLLYGFVPIASPGHREPIEASSSCHPVRVTVEDSSSDLPHSQILTSELKVSVKCRFQPAR